MTKYFHLSIITSCHKSLIHECVTGQRRVTEMNVEQVRREGNERRKKKKITWNWLSNRNTIEFLGIWEQLNNPDFKPVEFDGIRMQTGLNSFTLTPKQWIEKTGTIGIISKAGRYGGTYAHKDIAFEFASWISVEFKLYLIKEFQRLKDDENRRLSLAWNLNRTISRLNYRIHTDAIKAHLIPALITPAQAAITYASEADILNVALFGQTARQWRDANPKLDGNSVLSLQVVGDLICQT